jgi:putative DNA methylase
MSHRPNVLIENWLPFEELGVESQRERGASSALPPLYFLHVWWARRPLTASRASILTGVLPVWDTGWPDALKKQFPDPDSYHRWVIHLLGIRGNPIEAKKLLQWSKLTGNKLDSSPYNAPRAFTVNPDPDDLRIMGDLLEYTWGSREVSVMDVTAGGGSIPFEALRYGFTTYANELNPVASVILKATLDYPARFGESLAHDIRKWGDVWAKRVEEKLAPYFPKEESENIFAYLWARTVACPATGKPVPLSPNWWLSRDKGGIAAQLVTDPAWDAPRFLIKTGDAIDFDPNRGTVSRGTGLSPWTNEAIDGDYIKAEAQAGRMGQMLYAVAVKRRGGFDFRAPTDDDLAAVARAKAELARRLPEWEAQGWVPVEAYPAESNDPRPITYGMPRWADFFSPRQLLSMLTFLEELHEINKELRGGMTQKRAEAVGTYLAFAFDKTADYNAILATWEVSRQIVKHVFKRHDFAFTWSYGEFDAASNLLTWGVNQIEDAYKGLTKLSKTNQYPLWNEKGHQPVDRLHISQGSATDLDHIEDGAIHNITFDPPYYDNVMYAELSDFFYVWMKRSVGQLFPEFFSDHLTNKEDEAVANVARFNAMGSKKKKLAEKDYERKMEAIFRECHRVLRDDGVLTIMFTHKKVEAWDTLASALINAGFTVKASWPVHTESEHSLHQAKKNAAASTILLTCRKRIESGEPVWWEDIRARVRRIAREKAEEFAAQGISGVDLYISTFGPALSVISEQWPVLTSEVDEKTGEPLPLRPETALDLAREEVVSLRKQGLLLGRDIEFDAITDWYLMAWDAFGAEEFPYDEARKLAIALGVDLDGDLRGRKNLVTKKSSSVVMQTPRQRRKRGMVDPELAFFETMVDAVHTALLVLEEDGTYACEVFLNRSGLMGDGAFRQCVQAMINAIPRTRIKKNWARIEAELLERLRLNFFTDLAVPVEEELPNLPTQLDMFDDGAELTDDDEAPDEDDA